MSNTGDDSPLAVLAEMLTPEELYKMTYEDEDDEDDDEYFD